MSNQFPIYKMNTWWNSLNRNFSFLLSGAMTQLGLKNITSLWLLMRKNVYVSLFHRDRVKNFHHWDSDCKIWICLIKKQLLFISRIALQEIALLRECSPNLRKRLPILLMKKNANFNFHVFWKLDMDIEHMHHLYKKI